MNTTFKYSIFVMCIDSNDDDLKKWYENKVKEHNEHVLQSSCPNSGFDLACPKDMIIESSINTTKMSTCVRGKMMHYGIDKCMGYYMYPRSSIAKTPLVLSNHVGIIDSGYRGCLTGAFRNLSDSGYEVKKYDRLLQICHPNLQPFIITIVNSVEELGDTERGEGGFGSTGK